MLRIVLLWCSFTCFAPTIAVSQTQGVVRGADERFKADILVVVAHPDDEGAVTPYLARAIYDLHKRVAVVYATHGGSGGNNYGREHAGALADIREMEAREACARLGITNVWFLDGKDTASQNVLNSLANWGHGANLEKMVELIRLTRPDVMITSLPGVFIGENHGDHQAAGVIATEAFDLAGSPTAFPEQLAGVSPKRELYLENLMAWRPSKIYYFPDAHDEKQFEKSGPAYSILEISPSQRKPYWRLAMTAAMTHLTQYPEDIERISKLSDAEIEKMMKDPNQTWWTEPETLVFGKSVVGGSPKDDVFANIPAGPPQRPGGIDGVIGGASAPVKFALSGPWGFYEKFRLAHELGLLPVAKVPEIAVKTGTPVYVPLVVCHSANEPIKITVQVEAPAGWKVTSGQGEFSLPDESTTELRVELDTPQLSQGDLKKAEPQLVTVRAELDGKPLGEVKLRVLLRASALPQ
ncbi:MAG TPA: PIG-L family deacetylase [Candidatus Acidoferrum sp.]|nr:PIG-L family deacetylase [Candidatus Acidoferrum sp.]